MSRRSRLQKEVLSLYRAFLRACDGKPASTRDSIRVMFREEAASVKRSNTLHIEWLLRRAKRQLQYLKNADKVFKL